METSDMTFIRGKFPFPLLYAVRVNRLFNQDETIGIFSMEILFGSAALAVIAYHQTHREPKTVLPVVIGSPRNFYRQMTKRSVVC
jgi:hypothetical protein